MVRIKIIILQIVPNEYKTNFIKHQLLRTKKNIITRAEAA